jgi:hypothetical protein
VVARATALIWRLRRIPAFEAAVFNSTARSLGCFENLSNSQLSISLDESLDIGSDTRTPVDSSYKLPFRFTGKIDKLTYKIGAEQLSESDHRVMEEHKAKARDWTAIRKRRILAIRDFNPIDAKIISSFLRHQQDHLACPRSAVRGLATIVI